MIDHQIAFERPSRSNPRLVGCVLIAIGLLTVIVLFGLMIWGLTR